MSLEDKMFKPLNYLFMFTIMSSHIFKPFLEHFILFTDVFDKEFIISCLLQEAKMVQPTSFESAPVCEA